MANLNVLNLEGKQKGKIDISDEFVTQEMNDELIHQEVRRYLAAGRAGTHKVKERSEVSGGGRKPWRQKGTGNARAGSNRSPIWRHGGIVFGPKPRDYSFKLNKKVIKKARLIALTEKFKNDRIMVLENLEFEEPKTKKAGEILSSLKVSGEKVLLVIESVNDLTGKSFRNIPEVKTVSSRGLNTYDILVADYLIFTKKSLTDFTKGLGDERS